MLLTLLLAHAAFAGGAAPSTTSTSTGTSTTSTEAVHPETSSRRLLVPPPNLHGTPHWIEPIVNGTVTSDYPQIVAMIGHSTNYGDQVFCSGTLIDSTHVVTAAHCVVGFEDEFKPYGFTWEVAFGGGNIFNNATDVITVKKYTAHESYDANTLRNDIGIVTMSKAITTVTPMVVNDEIVTNAWYDTGLTDVGFGITGDNLQNAGTKRYTTLALDQYDAQFIYTYSADTNLCSGDSGGGLLEVTADGPELAGVNSFVYADSRDPDPNTPCVGGGAGETRVDKYVDWLEGQGAVVTVTHAGGGDTGGGDTGSSSSGGDTLEDTDWTDPARPPEDAYVKKGLGCETAPASSSSASLALGLLAALTIRRRGLKSIAPRSDIEA